MRRFRIAPKSLSASDERFIAGMRERAAELLAPFASHVRAGNMSVDRLDAAVRSCANVGSIGADLAADLAARMIR